MQRPPRSASPERLLYYYGAYAMAQMAGDPEILSIREEFGLVQTQLQRCLEEMHQARVAAMDALVVRDLRCHGLSDAVGSFAHSLRQVVFSDFRAPLYTSYFPHGTGGVTKRPSEVEIGRVKKILVRLATESEGRLNAHIGPLEQALDAFEEAVRAHKAALHAKAEAAGRLQTERFRWFAGYGVAWSRLRIRFRDNPRLADRFFRRVRTVREDAEQEALEEEAARQGMGDGGNGEVPLIDESRLRAFS